MLPPQDANAEATPFNWSWLDVPIPWFDESMVAQHTFPLPVAHIASRLEGSEAQPLIGKAHGFLHRADL